MSDSSFDDEVIKLSREVAELVIKKRNDYGTDNILKNIVDPELVISVRVHEKLARLVNLVKENKSPSNESLKDTADDIIGYGLVLRMVLDGTFENLTLQEMPF